ncbi:MAG: hypothetical protein LBR12_02580 [Opitutaceae bacterium]|jgi:NADPH-dependent curcumin reductase CurA|nr:hypothetical protein [Opitutaceae bacterium]
MKTYSQIALLTFAVVCCGNVSQAGFLDKLTKSVVDRVADRAEKKVSDKTNEAADKAVDSVFESTGQAIANATASSASVSATAADKAAIQKFLEQFQGVFEKSGDNQTFTQLKSTVSQLKNLDTSGLPADVKTKYAAFAKGFEDHVGELATIFKDTKISDSKTLQQLAAEYVAANPSLNSKLTATTAAMQQSTSEFMVSLLPYLMK